MGEELKRLTAYPPEGVEWANRYLACNAFRSGVQAVGWNRGAKAREGFRFIGLEAPGLVAPKSTCDAHAKVMMTMPVLSVSLAAIVSLMIAIMVFAMRMMMTHSNDLPRMMTMTMFETLGARGL